MVEPVAIISLRGISYSYPGGRKVLDGIDFEFRADDRMGVVGPTGAGKTTLAMIIMGLVKPLAGSVEVFGQIRSREKDFREVRARIGFLFQDADDQLFCPTVAEDVAFGPLNLGVPRNQIPALVEKTLARLGLQGFEDRVTYKLSGGEKRLVSLAAVLAMSPEMLLLDEPTTGLDEATQARLVRVLREADLPYMIISHDQDFLNQTTKSLIQVNNGSLMRLA